MKERATACVGQKWQWLVNTQRLVGRFSTIVEWAERWKYQVGNLKGSCVASPG